MFFLWTFFVAIVIAWILDKMEKLAMYQVNRNEAVLHNQYLQAAIDTKRAQEKYFKARAWEIIVNSKEGANFTVSEVEALRAMGLEDYLDDEDDFITGMPKL